LFRPSLPAAATKSMPALPLAAMASFSACSNPPPPQLLLVRRMFTPLFRMLVE